MKEAFARALARRGARPERLSRPDLSSVYLSARLGAGVSALVVNTVLAAVSGRPELWVLPVLPVPSIIHGLLLRKRRDRSVVVPLSIDIMATGVFMTLAGLGEVAVAYGLLLMAATGTLAPLRHIRWMHPVIAGWMAVALVAAGSFDSASRWNPGAATAFMLVHVSIALVALAGVAGAMMRRLRTAEEQRNRLIGGFTHDMRNALTSAVGVAEPIIEQYDDLESAEIAEYAGLVVAEGREAVAMTEDLLTLSRAEAGRLSVVRRPIDLTAEAAKVAGSATSDGEVTLAIAEAPAIGIGDPVRTRQIIRNLVSNARRYGGDEITISTGETGGFAFLRVADSGKPIRAEDRERIFDAYTRARDRAAHSQSVGLGLTISRHLARLMQGNLTYRHRDGWSVFEFTLPTEGIDDDSRNGHATVETDTEVIWLGDDGILRTRIRPDARIELADAQAGVAGYRELAGGTKRPILVHAEEMAYLAMDARTHYIRSPEAAECLSAVALVAAGSPTARFMANLINKLGQPPFPTRLFEDEAEAIAWLCEQ